MKIEQIENKIKEITKSGKFKGIIYTLLVIFILFFVFQAGQFTGIKRANFRCNWGDNYARNFGPRDFGQKPISDGLFNNLPNPHGSIGKIIKNNYPEIVILDKDQTEKIVVINDDTNILERKDNVSKDELKVDSYVVVIGNPNEDGKIDAKLIRIMPTGDGFTGMQNGPRGGMIER